MTKNQKNIKKKVLSALQAYPNLMSVNEIAKKVSLGYWSVRAALFELALEGKANMVKTSQARLFSLSGPDDRGTKNENCQVEVE